MYNLDVSTNIAAQCEFRCTGIRTSVGKVSVWCFFLERKTEYVAHVQTVCTGHPPRFVAGAWVRGQAARSKLPNPSLHIWTIFIHLCTHPLQIWGKQHTLGRTARLVNVSERELIYHDLMLTTRASCPHERYRVCTILHLSMH